ncbi:MAG TPA: hypothetical protein VEK08_22510 [Planctomycetota bacterium]|nr:hypothetical protein [Planctomycetota bacterium]
MSIFIESHAVGTSSFIRQIRMDYPTSGPPPDPAGFGGDIHVSMKGARTYVYAVPDAYYFINFKNAASKGRYYDRVIKRFFDYYRRY